MKRGFPNTVIAFLLVLLLAVAVTGCGDDETPENGDAPAAASEPTESAGVDGSDTGNTDGKLITAGELETCLESSNLKLDDSGQVPGTSKGRLGITVDDAEYAGFVYWSDSKNVADVYIAKDLDGAEATEEQIREFFAGFGGDAGDLVARRGSIVIQRDDDSPPTPDEFAAILDCAA